MSASQPADDAARREELLDAAEQLIWNVIDGDQVDDAQVTELENLLSANDEVRQRYLECVQLHVDLTDHFAEKKGPDGNGKAVTPVLGNLLSGGGFPGGVATPTE